MLVGIHDLHDDLFEQFADRCFLVMVHGIEGHDG
jgi:hypothetical protein